MKKVLYIATSDIHLSTFHRPYIKWLSKKGCQVDIAVENRGNNTFEHVNNHYYLDFPRKLFSGSLRKSYKILKQIIDKGDYDLIHCHTPIPSMLARLAARKARRKGAKLLYTAHGFHFYKGAPLSRWLIYYTAEYLLSKYTDGIITMNKEDFSRINNKMLHKRSHYIPGMGVDKNDFFPIIEKDKLNLRVKYGFNETDFIIIYIAEFIPRKNHDFILSSMVELTNKISNLKVLFAGKGDLLEEMKSKSNGLGLSNAVNFLGFRSDIPDLIRIADIGISASKHEGLPIGVLQEMFCGLPVVVSIERGQKDLVEEGYSGFFFDQNNTNQFVEHINVLYNDSKKRIEMGENAYTKAKDFEIAKSLEAMAKIYLEYL